MGNDQNGVEGAQNLRHLTEIGLALSAERDIDRLLDLILTKGREMTGADAGTMYTVEENNRENPDDNTLYFRAAQNDSIHVESRGQFPVSHSSLAGYVALTGETLCFDDVYDLPQNTPYSFDPSFDAKHNYRACSILIVPLRDHNEKNIGVLQLINRKRQPEVRLSPQNVEEEVLPFDEASKDLAASLASQAAVALSNNLLLQRIEDLFASLVAAASETIEDRDPCTSGHSKRVTALTLGLARAATEANDGPFKDVHFSERQMRELEYAGLLHDFGKIGVREHILTKSHKLEPWRFQAVKDRLLLMRGAREQEYSRRKITALQQHAGQADELLSKIDAESVADFAGIDADLEALERANDPQVTFTPDEEYCRQQELLDRLATFSYRDEKGAEKPLISSEEREALSIRKGSLTGDEYHQIQEHASMSYEFLKRIKWTDDFKDIPLIAYCHHEKLNGKGYPRGVSGDAIPMASRMMTVADIFDALTAKDRPYKIAVTLDRALGILRQEAEQGGLDPNLVELFISERIYELVEQSSEGPEVCSLEECGPASPSLNTP